MTSMTPGPKLNSVPCLSRRKVSAPDFIFHPNSNTLNTFPWGESLAGHQRQVAEYSKLGNT